MSRLMSSENGEKNEVKLWFWKKTFCGCFCSRKSWICERIFLAGAAVSKSLGLVGVMKMLSWFFKIELKLEKRICLVSQKESGSKFLEAYVTVMILWNDESMRARSHV